MRLFRFCSYGELEALKAGITLDNNIDHSHGGHGGSDSVGFCFTADPPDVAWKYLKGLVTPDICVEYEIPPDRLRKGVGKYAGSVRHKGNHVIITPMLKPEWSTTTLSTTFARIVRVICLDDFVPADELEVVRHFDRILKPLRLRYNYLKSTSTSNSQQS